MHKNNTPEAATLSQAKTLFEGGQAAFAQAQYVQALEQWMLALQLVPNRVSLLINLSAVLIKLQRYQEAERYAEQALQQDQTNSMAWKNLLQARQWLQSSSNGSAKAAYHNVIDTLNDLDRPAVSRAQVLIAEQRYSEALLIYDGLLQANPAQLPALIGKSLILARLPDQREALEFMQHALQHQPLSQDLWINHGLILSNAGQHDTALVAYQKALAINPANPVARQHLAQAQLLNGDYHAGWSSYEARFALHPELKHRELGLPRLDQLQRAIGKTLLVWAEQGYGDTIQFCRFLPPMQAMGINIHLEVPVPLHRLLSGNLCLTITDRIADASIYDFQIPLLSIPALFLAASGSPVFVPGDYPYLRIKHHHAPGDQPPEPKSSRSRPAIGIACSGNPAHANDAQRSIALEVFLPLTEFADVHLLQPELRASDQHVVDRHPHRFRRFGAMHDFLDTAESIARMDYVVSVDTAIAHLAGAMAKPLFLLLPTNPDWRWGAYGESTAWYPRASLFRRPADGNWTETLVRVVTAIESAWGKSTD